MFTLYLADGVGQETNCYYPHAVTVTDAAGLADAVSHDYVCAAYRNSRRGKVNFIRSDCAAFDVDNDHSENSSDWLTPEMIVFGLPGVTVGIHYSRSHMRQKGGFSPRPRFHFLVPIRPTSDPLEYEELKLRLAAIFPRVDPRSLDIARFFFGTVDPKVEFFPGTRTLSDLLEEMSGAGNPDETQEDFDTAMRPGTYGDSLICEGRRNATMSRCAGRLVKRYGPTEEAYRLFLQQAERCDPPLDGHELSAIWKSACRFARKVQAQPGYIPPDQYDSSLRPDDFSDIGQAKVVAADCGSVLAYTDGTDFLVYNGRFWLESKQKAVGLMESFLDRQLADAELALSAARQALLDCGVDEMLLRAGGRALERGIRPDQSGAYGSYVAALNYRGFVMKRRDIKYITSALQAVRPMVQLEMSDLDRDENLLNCPDGTYDLREGMNGRRDHDPSDLITKMTPYAPGPEGEELWRRTLETTFCSDRELIDYVQQIVGLCAIGAVYQEALIIAYGDGSNGKSTFWNTISGALGNYSGAISADTLTAGCRRNVRPELAEVKGKRLLIAAELEEGVQLSTSIVKQLCSTDEIAAEKKYKDPFKFRPTHTLVLYTNHLPKVGAMDTGIWRRLIVIPFDAKIRGKSDIKNYSKYLLEHAGPAIVRWIIEGAQKAIASGYHLQEPLCVHAAMESYRSENDWMGHFLDTCCVIDEDEKEKSGELYSAFRAFIIRCGDKPKGTNDFYHELEKRGFSKRKERAGSFIHGLKLAEFEADL